MANILDRMTGGSVIDLLDLGWRPAFNLADVFIVAGAAHVLLLGPSGFQRDLMLTVPVPPTAVL